MLTFKKIQKCYQDASSLPGDDADIGKVQVEQGMEGFRFKL